MADLVQTAADVALVDNESQTQRVRVGEAVTQGMPVYLKSADRKYWKAQHDGSAEEARCLAAQVRARDYSPPRREKILEFQALQEKYAGLGRVAGELNDALQTSLQSAGGQPVPEMAATLNQVGERLGQAADQAQALAQEAEQKEFSDMVRHADALRQQVLSTKNRLQLLADKLRQGVH